MELDSRADFYDVVTTLVTDIIGHFHRPENLKSRSSYFMESKRNISDLGVN